MDVGVVLPARRGGDEHIVRAGCDLRQRKRTIDAHLHHPAALRVARLARPQYHDQARWQLPAFRRDYSPVQVARLPWSQLNTLKIRVAHLQRPPGRHPVHLVEASSLDLKTIRAWQYVHELELPLG